MSNKVILLEGDGIGPEITREVVKIMEKIESLFPFKTVRQFEKIGGQSIDHYGLPLTEETINACQSADAVFLAAVGHEKYNNLPLNLRPETGLLELRKSMGVFANIRPGKILGPLKNNSPLKPSLIEKPIDLCVVRELTGGIYFGEKTQSEDGNYASDLMAYSKYEIKRVAKIAFDMAMTRSKKLCSVDKANVLQSSRLWRSVVDDMAKEYPEVTVQHLYVDNAAMQLVLNPGQFDVILTSNMFGDILSDEMSVIMGSIGVLPSASFDAEFKGLYEPIHGSAPDIEGENLANPIASILSIAMMYRNTFNQYEMAELIENAVLRVLEKGYRTKDLCMDTEDYVKTSEMGDLVLKQVQIEFDKKINA